jgi:uroporphyrinogen decarboxylase
MENSQDFAPLITDRLRLRPLQAGDAAALHRLVNDWEVAKTLARVPFPYPRDLADEWIASTRAQIAAGADAIQIFDSWGGIIAGSDYEAASLKWIRHIIAALPADFPIILYAKGTAPHLTDQAFTGARALSVDWTCDLAIVRRTLPANVALQGNLDPVLLNTTPEIVRRETTRLLESMRGTTGHIFNLGHGITPRATIENFQTLVDTVTQFR